MVTVPDRRIDCKVSEFRMITGIAFMLPYTFTAGFNRAVDNAARRSSDAFTTQ